jgi:flagellar basal body P-ring formation protein FlgA
MTIHLLIAPIANGRPGLVSPMMVLRVALTLLALSLAIGPSLAAERLVMRADVRATGEVLTLADLVDGATGPQASRPLFRAPALGASGTIQARRVLDAARGLGIGPVDTRGRIQVSVTRVARRIGSAEIEAAVKQALERRHGLDVRALSMVFDGNLPMLLVAPEVKDPVSVDDVSYDRRSRRVTAVVSVGAEPEERRATGRVSGVMVEVIEVAVLNRSVARGEIVRAADFTLERRARESVPSDVQTDGLALAGQVARRALTAGSIVRAGDLARPEIVGRGDAVTIVYEVPGLVLALRGRANEAGAQGDLITVTNPQSKKVLQAQVVAPGKVSVSAPLPGPVATASVPLRP